MSSSWIPRLTAVLTALLLCLAVTTTRATEKSAELRGSLLAADAVVIHEGLPKEGSELYRTESKRDDVVTVHGFAFYTEPASCTRNIELLAALTTDDLLQPWGQKLCGGFHPDYMLVWQRGETQCTVMICLGCEDIYFTEGKLRYKYGMSPKRVPALKKLLAAYDDKRPKTQWQIDQEKETAAQLERHQQRPTSASEAVRASLLAVEDATVYVTVPFDADDSDVRKQADYELELAVKKELAESPIDIDRHTFYRPGRAAPKKSALRTLLSAATTYDTERQIARESLPYGDYAVAWMEGEVECAAIVCFGTNEVIFRRGDEVVVHGLQAEAVKALKAELRAYDDLRIDPEVLRRKAEDVLGD